MKPFNITRQECSLLMQSVKKLTAHELEKKYQDSPALIAKLDAIYERLFDIYEEQFVEHALSLGVKVPDSLLNAVGLTIQKDPNKLN